MADFTAPQNMSRTFGHRYLDISFMIAQSALRCSLCDSDFSDSKGSCFVAGSGGRSLRINSGLMPSLSTASGLFSTPCRTVDIRGSSFLCLGVDVKVL